MKLKIILVGKTIGSPLKEGIADYAGRLKHYAAFSIEVLKKANRPTTPPITL